MSDSGEKPRETEKQREEDQNEGEGSAADGRKQQKEYFKEELKRLKTSLNKESTKIKAPTKKAYTPYTFNTLEPYYNVHTAAYLIELPDEVRHGYMSRQTALGLTDPWVDLSMDVNLLPKIQSRPVVQDKNAKKKKSTKEKRPKEGSTRLPKFPAVAVPAGDLTTKTLYYSDVPMLRRELKKKYTDNAETKVSSEYERTKQDFYRMELDKMNDYHPINRPHMRACYFAYLQNNAGSKKAVYECVKDTEKQMDETSKQEKEDDNEPSPREEQHSRQEMHQQQEVEASA